MAALAIRPLVTEECIADVIEILLDKLPTFDDHSSVLQNLLHGSLMQARFFFTHHISVGMNMFNLYHE